MYISDFSLGVIVTLAIEFVLCVAMVSVSMWRNRNEDNNDKSNE